MKAQPWPLYPLERNTVPTVQDTGWEQGSLWTGAGYLVPKTGFNPKTMQPIASPLDGRQWLTSCPSHSNPVNVA